MHQTPSDESPVAVARCVSGVVVGVRIKLITCVDCREGAGAYVQTLLGRHSAFGPFPTDCKPNLLSTISSKKLSSSAAIREQTGVSDVLGNSGYAGGIGEDSDRHHDKPTHSPLCWKRW